MTKEIIKIHNINIEYKTDYPNSDTPVSFDKEGNIVSRFQDAVWDFSHQCITPYTKGLISFYNLLKYTDNIISDKIIYEYKIIAYGLIYFNTNTSKQQKTETIINSQLSDVRKLLRVAIDCKSTLSNISNNKLLIKNLFNYLSNVDLDTFNNITSTLKKISSISTIYTNNNFSLTNEQFRELENIKRCLIRIPPNQHLVVPTEIYLRLNDFIDIKLAEFTKYSDNIFNIIDKFPNINNSKTFIDTCKENNLENYCSVNKIKSKRYFTKHIINIETLALTKILMFTGMRHGESLLLPLNCFEKIKLKNKDIFTLTGYTTKYQSSATKTTWITSSQILPAINVLRSITLNTLKSLSIENTMDINIPLACFHAKNIKNNNKLLYDLPTKSALRVKEVLDHFSFDLKIDSKAFNELERTSPLNDLYEDYNIEIGADFPITPHQFRRSLCVYAARSGFVNLSALKEQLKHIKTDMTEYYANYAGDATNIFDIDLCSLLKEQIILEQMSNFAEDVLNNFHNNNLYGGEGSRLNIAKQNSAIPTFLTDENETLKAFKDGKLAYRRTPLGGCSKLTRCNNIEEISITACITCADAIFNERTDKALQIALSNFYKQLKSLEPNTPFSIHLLSEIKQLESLIRKRHIQLMENSKNE